MPGFGFGASASQQQLVTAGGVPAWSETNPAVIIAWMQRVFANANAGIPASETGPLSPDYAMGSVLLPNGKVLLVPGGLAGWEPDCGVAYRVYDQDAGTLTEGDADTGCYGCCLLPSGRVVSAPFGYGTKVKLYDYLTDTASDGPVATGYMSPSLAANGKVIMAPYSAAAIGIYDDALGTFSNGPALTGYASSIRAPNGNIIFSSMSNSKLMVFNPATGVLSDGPLTDGVYASMVLAPSGKIICIPWPATNVAIYDPDANTIVKSAIVMSHTYYGGCVLPDGRIYFAAYNALLGAIYDPIADSIEDVSSHISSTTGATLMPGGRVAVCASVEHMPIYFPNCGTIAIESLLTPWLNHF